MVAFAQQEKGVDVLGSPRLLAGAHWPRSAFLLDCIRPLTSGVLGRWAQHATNTWITAAPLLGVRPPFVFCQHSLSCSFLGFLGSRRTSRKRSNLLTLSSRGHSFDTSSIAAAFLHTKSFDDFLYNSLLSISLVKRASSLLLVARDFRPLICLRANT